MSVYRAGAGGTVALVIAHCAGMIDLIALPVWVGALVERFGFRPQQAGGLVTLFLCGAVAASIVVAPRINRLNQRIIASIGFAVAALAFALASGETGLWPLAALHLIAGVSVGTALSMIHGTMGRSPDPHRLYALAGIALGLFAMVLLGVIPQLLIAFGAAALFVVFAAVMAIASATSALLFVNPLAAPSEISISFSRAVWFTIFGVSAMTFNQAMVFSFVEVIGKTRGFSAQSVLGVLIALGLVNFAIPSPLAVALQKNLAASRVVQIGPAVQAILGVLVTTATIFTLWAPAAAVFVAVQIFTQTFAFGLLGRLDPSGRAAAATPAMLMTGAALGPIAGGALSDAYGFGALGIAAVIAAITSIALFTKATAA